MPEASCNERIFWPSPFFFASAPAVASAQVNPSVIADAVVRAADDSWKRECYVKWPPKTEEQTAPVRAAAVRLMAAYLERAATGDVVDASDLFTRGFSKAWFFNGRAAKVNKVRDPLAARLRAERLEPKLTAFIFSRDGKTAIGTWEISGQPGASTQGRIGYYRSMLRLDGNLWRLMGVFVTEGAGDPLPVQDYCFISGDVQKYEAQQRTKAAR